MTLYHFSNHITLKNEELSSSVVVY